VGKERLGLPSKGAKTTTESGNRPGRPARQVGNPDKRDQILDAAEELFAQFGFHGVTVREVTQKANVDVALVYYYFANKRAMFDEVLARRANIVNRERIDLLEKEPVTPGDDAIERLVVAFVDPIYRYLATGDLGWRHYFALIAQINNASEWGQQVMPGFFDPIALKLIDKLRVALPDATDEDLFWGFDFLSGALTLTMAGTGRIDRLSNGLCQSTDYHVIRNNLPRFVAAGFKQLYADRRAGRVAGGKS
jgi:AcrR family transcriptional regulator